MSGCAGVRVEPGSCPAALPDAAHYKHTPEQEEKWARFLAEATPLLPKDPAVAHIYCEDWVHRFLVARKWDYDAAMRQLTGSLAWRQSIGADTITSEPPPDPRIDELVARGIHGRSRDGFFVLWERPGLSRYDTIVPTVGVDAMVRAKVYNRETQRQRSIASGLRFRLVVVVDVKGLSFNIMSPMVVSLARTLGKVDGDNYPENLERAIIINASWIFTQVWKVGRTFVDKDVAAKVQVLGTDYAEELQRFIAPDQLPVFAGGTCATPCPWAADPLRCGDVDLADLGAAVGAGAKKVTIKAGKTERVEAPPAPEGGEVLWEVMPHDKGAEVTVEWCGVTVATHTNCAANTPITGHHDATPPPGAAEGAARVLAVMIRNPGMMMGKSATVTLRHLPPAVLDAAADPKPEAVAAASAALESEPPAETKEMEVPTPAAE